MDLSIVTLISNKMAFLRKGPECLTDFELNKDANID